MHLSLHSCRGWAVQYSTARYSTVHRCGLQQKWRLIIMQQSISISSRSLHKIYLTYSSLWTHFDIQFYGLILIESCCPLLKMEQDEDFKVLIILSVFVCPLWMFCGNARHPNLRRYFKNLAATLVTSNIVCVVVWLQQFKDWFIRLALAIQILTPTLRLGSQLLLLLRFLLEIITTHSW